MNKDDLPIKPNLFRISPRTYKIDEEDAKKTVMDMYRKYSSIEAWQKRRQEVEWGILKGAGLFPLPKKESLNPIIRNKKKCNDYTVENVALETFPGFYCTGNLYRPRFKSNSFPAVLSPHGHFAAEGGRFSRMVQARCARLAQMGIITFSYDMVGWGESLQVPHTNDYVFSYQLWNSIRALDFLLLLDGIDPSRIGVTGCSGGGTQSFMLTAVDSRITLSVPVTMVSAHFLGGCICESGLPIHEISQTNNVEIAALAAPRPQLLISVCSDFTRNTPLVEFPFLKRIYALFDASEQVENVHLLNEKHDYGYNKRRALYRFVARHFKLPLIEDEHLKPGSFPEGVSLFSKEQLCVFGRRELRSRCKPMAETLYNNLLCSIE